MRIEVIFPDGEKHQYEVKEVIISEPSANITIRNSELVISSDEEN
jgi:hypothetical protein